MTLVVIALAATCARGAVACDPIQDDVRAALDARHYEEAERAALAAIARSPDSAPPQISLAQVYLEWSRLTAVGQPQDALDPVRSAQAVEVLEAVLARWPGLVRPHVCLLDLHQLRGDYAAFFAALERALESFPSSNVEIVESLEFTLRRFLENEQYELANRECALLEPREAITVPVLSNCALAHLHAEDLDAALAGFGKARARDPKDGLVAHNLAMLESLTGDLAAAERTLTELAAVEPERGEVLLRVAVVATARDPAGSVPAWRRVVAHAHAHPDSRDSETASGFARQTLAALATSTGLDASSLVTMARALVQTEAPLSIALLRRASALSPDDPSPYYVMGQAFEIIGLTSLAFDALARAAAFPRPAQPALDIPAGAIDFEAGRVATALGRYADAVAHLERARRANTEFPNLQYLFGHAYEGMGEAAAARAEYAACLERQNNAEYVDWCRKNAVRLAGAPAVRAPATESFETALAKARANEANRAGQRFATSSTKVLGPRLGAAVAACVPRLAEAESWQETLLLRIDADGAVAETLQPASARAPACFAAQLRDARVDVPPAADWWLVYEISVQP
jgi:tetratricopeptide (TPR) repeat protein